MDTWIYYHNPRCSKSREGKELLDKNNISFTIKEYLKEPLTVGEIEKLFDLLKMEPIQLIRTKEEIFSQLGLNTKELNKREWAQMIVDHPILLERPILAGKNVAMIGRPPEKLLEIISV